MKIKKRKREVLKRKNKITAALILTLVLASFCLYSAETNELTKNKELQTGESKLPGTAQLKFYDNTSETAEITTGNAFFGQNANYPGNAPSYRDNHDGTVSDLVTGLMWQKSADTNSDGKIDYDDKMSYDEAMSGASSFQLAGYNDWRLPTIKELYSLIIFSGVDPSGIRGNSSVGLVPFINTEVFGFGFGDATAGERIIDAQFASSTLYVSTTMNKAKTMFGVNFADGRIKGYPTAQMPGRSEPKQFYVLYVRGNTNYGKNNFTDNGDSTITDRSTGLMWMQKDNGEGLNWEAALQYAENMEFAGHSDWRLPDVKELQSLVDYTRSPSTTHSAAIDPLFECTTITNEAGQADYPWYWSGTTHVNSSPTPGANAAYVCFGRAMGYMSQFGGWVDVHGAGAQRSDPKAGNPDDYPRGHGPQGDAIRVYNFVRLVRNAN